MQEIEELEGIKVGDFNENNIRYADDTVRIADSDEKLRQIVETVKEAGERRG